MMPIFGLQTFYFLGIILSVFLCKTNFGRVFLADYTAKRSLVVNSWGHAQTPISAVETVRRLSVSQTKQWISEYVLKTKLLRLQ